MLSDFTGSLLQLMPGPTAAHVLVTHLSECFVRCSVVVGFTGALEGRIVWGINRNPKTLAAARSNVFAALGHLGMLTALTCPRGLLHEVEHILQVLLHSRRHYKSLSLPCALTACAVA